MSNLSVQNSIRTVGASWMGRTLPRIAVHKPSSADMRSMSHPFGAVLYASPSGLGLRIGNDLIAVPRGSAVWLPPHVQYRFENNVEAVCIELNESECGALPLRAKVFMGSTFLRHLISHVNDLEANSHPNREARIRSATLLISEELKDSLRRGRLPFPWDQRVARIAVAVTSNPADDVDLKAWGKRIGLSPRHITRKFYDQTGLSFAAWRAEVRVALAKDILATQSNVASVAERVGYRSKGAFIRMFKRITGSTPRQYLQVSREVG